MNDITRLTWSSPSKDSGESMPLGGGGLGLNVWFEEGKLYCYYQLSGTFDEHNGFPKLGRLCIWAPDEKWSSLTQFQQRLCSDTASITLEWYDQSQVHYQVEIWVNQYQNVFHIELHSSSASVLCAELQNWRFQDRLSPAQAKDSYIFGERNDIFGYWMYPQPLTRHRDHSHVSHNAVCWYHANDNNDLAFDKEMDQQGFGAFKAQLYNPQKDLVFGSRLSSKQMAFHRKGSGEYLGTPYQSLVLISTATHHHHRIDVHCLSGQYASPEQWQDALSEQAQGYAESDYQQQRQQTLAWWHAFWQRSWVQITPHETSDSLNREVAQVSANYRWFRFMQGFNFNAQFPLKFNGGNLTYDSRLVGYIEDQRDIGYVREIEQEKQSVADQVSEIEANENLRLLRDFGPDYRAWGGGSITPQNQRLLYWPLLKSGDSDLFAPQFDWYKHTLNTAELRSHVAYDHGGCCYTEQINNFGLPIGSHFGWERPEGMGLGQQINRSCDDHYSTQLEFAYMMLEYHRYFEADIKPYLPFIESAADFFFQHFESQAAQQGRSAYDDNGHLIIFPSSALESYKEAKNPCDVTCGLRRTYQGLLELENIEQHKQATYRQRLAQIPPLVEREYRGHQTIAPADCWAEINNVELPQMYPIYPYQEFGVGLPQLQLARDTWEHSCNEIYGQRSYASWHQDGIFCAHLGLVDEAKRVLVCKLADSGRRFPAFWGPGHDWTPDHNWGGTGMIQLQEMLLQDKEGQIHLFPCWPRNWDVDFKLHAGSNTTVECRYQSGKLVELHVSPESQRQRVVVHI